jgi:hypothetical protein
MVVIVGVLPIASAYATARLVGSVSTGVIPFEAEADRKEGQGYFASGTLAQSALRKTSGGLPSTDEPIVTSAY